MRLGRHAAAGFTGLELLFAVALFVTVSSISVPPVIRALDDYRAAGAARYVAARLQRLRMDAILRSTEVGMKFYGTAGIYTFVTYVDGNRNGILTSDITSGIDRPIGAAERLGDSFTGVEFGTIPGLPAVDSGSSPPGSDPIRLGSGDIVSFNASGSSSSGSLYMKSRSRQFVVRLYGDTGKTRILMFDAASRRWGPG
jgi:hypothetical protein